MQASQILKISIVQSLGDKELLGSFIPYTHVAIPVTIKR